MILAAPAHPDGAQNITITDPVSGASTTMTAALTYGAAATDNIVLLYGLNTSTPVGAQAAHPVSVRVLAADGVTPVGGATIAWSATNSLQLSACAGASSCSVTSDQNGDAATWLTPAKAGVATITATLAPASYTSSKSVNATLYATETSSDIGIVSPFVWVSQGASVSVPLTAQLLSNGVARNNVQVNYALVNGTGTLSAASAQTNSKGYATVNLTVTQFTGMAQVTACAAPGNVPCGTFYVNPVPLAQQHLEQISGAGQVSTGQALQPVVVEVTDSATPPNAVVAAPVAFLETVLRPGGSAPGTGDGETNPGNSAMPVILQVSQSNAATDGNGLASIVPSSGGFSPPLEVDVSVTAGAGAVIDDPLQVLPAVSRGNHSSEIDPPPFDRHPIGLLW